MIVYLKYYEATMFRSSLSLCIEYCTGESIQYQSRMFDQLCLLVNLYRGLSTRRRTVESGVWSWVRWGQCLGLDGGWERLGVVNNHDVC